MRVLKLMEIPSTLTFTYTLDLTKMTAGWYRFDESEKMNGGLLQIDIPDDWDV